MGFSKETFCCLLCWRRPTQQQLPEYACQTREQPQESEHGGEAPSSHVPKKWAVFQSWRALPASSVGAFHSVQIKQPDPLPSPASALIADFLGSTLFLSGPKIHLQVKVITSSRPPSSAESTWPTNVDVRDTHSSLSALKASLPHPELQWGAQACLWPYLQVFMSWDKVASSWSKFLTSTWIFRNTRGEFSHREDTTNLSSS